MYKIVRVYFKASINKRTIQRGVTLEEARNHCKNPEASSTTCTTSSKRAITRRMGPWFDSYDKE